ncbi:TetR/AcrR family transcriptional regulator [Rhodococcus aerolatus]
MTRAGRATVTRERYFAAAMELLAADGPSALTLSRLCAAVGVTSGSFYHHFVGVDGFVGALLEHWEAQQTRRILEVVGASADPWQRVSVVKHLGAALPHRAEAAIRSWAAADAAVGAAQRRVDAERTEGLREVVAGVGVPPATASRLARLGVALLAGAQQTGHPDEPAVVLELFGDLEDLVRTHAARAGGG